MKRFIIALLLVLISIQARSRPLDLLLKEASETTYSLKKTDRRGDYFDFPSNLGTYFTSIYFVFRYWMEDFGSRPNDRIRLEKHLNLIKKSQLPNGSWFQVNDPNVTNQGHLDSTVMHYWLLKISGSSSKDPTMTKAREYILELGGIEKGTMLTKVFFALTDNYSWKRIPYVPYMIFNKFIPINDKDLGAWMKPVLQPVAYLRNNQVHKNLGERFSLSELNLESTKIENEKIQISSSDEKVLNSLLSTQDENGSWGGYTLSAMLVQMALATSGDFYKKHKHAISKSYEKTISFNEELHFKKGFFNFKGAYGDGHLWDTMLVSGALLEAGISEKRLYSSLDRLITFQTSTGGFPFGLDFGEFPDVDDTAEAIITLSRVKSSDRYIEFIKKGTSFILEMQNRDGGWAAFSKNNNGNFLLKMFTKKFEDSADLFDESSADVTGHVLEALGTVGLTVENSKEVRKAVEYLTKTNEAGIWKGRWGVNYIYGTSAVVVGLLNVGIRIDDPLIKNAMGWIVSKQNKDGGWGETTASDKNPSLAGIGISTPSQTSWALLALMEAHHSHLKSIRKGMEYLSKTYKKGAGWTDPSAVGTGHPNLLYMVYPSYPKAFPLMAIARYLEIKKNY